MFNEYSATEAIMVFITRIIINLIWFFTGRPEIKEAKDDDSLVV
jgi:hypothetical protein